jgi:hypothetical protein
MTLPCGRWSNPHAASEANPDSYLSGVRGPPVTTGVWPHPSSWQASDPPDPWAMSPAGEVDAASGRLVRRAWTADPSIGAMEPPTSLSQEQGATGWIARHREPLFIDDIARDARVLAAHWALSRDLVRFRGGFSGGGRRTAGCVHPQPQAGPAAGEQRPRDAQVFLNLVLNAEQAILGSGVGARHSGDCIRVSTSARLDGGRSWVVAQVVDNGPRAARRRAAGDAAPGVSSGSSASGA